MKKILSLGVILLFIGVAVAPSINFNTVKASNEDDLVEVTTQACGIKGYGNTTVKLTREQYQNLEQYLVDFRARLNQTSTREEAVPIYKEAVIELDKYGLLPNGMSVQQAQNLVTFSNRKVLQLRPIKPNILKQSNSLSNNNTIDFFCMIAGESTNTYFQTLLNTAAILLSGLFVILPSFFILGAFIWSVIHNVDSVLLYILAIIATAVDTGLLGVVFPFLLTHSGISVVGIIRYDSSQGWIHLTAHSNVWVNGTFNGSFPTIPNSDFTFMGSPGVIGFTGLHLRTNSTSHKSYYFGTALVVAVTS
jgi:hypothetical protein